jgi:predicted ArsR family transcriptional regulator
MASLLEPTRRQLYQLVAEEREPLSRDQAAAAVGVSRAMAAFHLDRLVDAGLLRAEYRRLSGRRGKGAGRPSKLYRRSATRLELGLPARDYRLLGFLLAEALSAGSTVDPKGVGHEYGRALGGRARQRLRGEPGSAALRRCVEDVLATLGFEPTRSAGGEIEAGNCPFDPISRRFPGVVCHTAVALIGGVIEGVAGADLTVRRVERPGWCCVIATPLSSPKTATDIR